MSPAAIHTCRPAAVIAVAVPRTCCVSTTDARSGSIREAVASSVLATHTPPAPATIGPGPEPTAISSRTRPLRGSSRATRPALGTLTQTEP